MNFIKEIIIFIWNLEQQLFLHWFGAPAILLSFLKILSFISLNVFLSPSFSITRT